MEPNGCCRIAILEMSSAEEAKKLIAGLDNTPMDRTHTFHLYRYADVVSCLEDKKDSGLPSKETYPPLSRALSVVYVTYSFNRLSNRSLLDLLFTSGCATLSSVTSSSFVSRTKPRSSGTTLPSL